ncbi:MAG: oligoendopeptidase F [Anaerolineae bacterium]|nr:MAG: oligoendopeptidase F [Anaerolineae bacterium]
MDTKTQLPTRDSIPEAFTWNAPSVFASPEAWEQAFQEAEARLPDLDAYRGRLAEGPQTLLEWFALSEAYAREAYRLFVYAGMSYAVDTTNQQAAARRSRIQGLAARYRAQIAFAEPEMIAIGFDTLRRWMQEEPRLAVYAHYFDRLERQQAHVRSSEVEALLGALSDPFRSAASIHGVMADADLRFEPACDSQGNVHEIGQGSINALITHPDREARRTAWEHYADAYLNMQNAMAACLATGVKQNVFMARARGYDSALEAALAPNAIPTKVFHNLIEVFRRHLPLWHRYWALRKRVFGLERLPVWDIKAPLLAEKVRIPYEQAVEWVIAGLQPLGEEYTTILRRGLTEERWVDVFPNRGKRAGAFSSGAPGTHPFIMMSYNQDIFSLSTLAHETGHSMHSYLAWRKQPFVYAHYSLFVAEVASNFHQALVRDYLLRTQNERSFQIAVLEEAMSNFHRYFFIMPTLARFELEIHQRVERGEGLTASVLNDLMADLFAEGYGDEVAYDRERVGITWAQFPTHLYANFYVYQYATGISAANALARGILDGKPDAVERYLAFLESGGALYPLDALAQAGVDMTSPEPVERAFAVLESYIARLEHLLL